MEVKIEIRAIKKTPKKDGLVRFRVESEIIEALEKQNVDIAASCRNFLYELSKLKCATS